MNLKVDKTILLFDPELERTLHARLRKLKAELNMENETIHNPQPVDERDKVIGDFDTPHMTQFNPSIVRPEFPA